MNARTPEDGDRLFAEALNAGKLDALVAQCGDLAVVSAKWDLAVAGPDGKPAKMPGQSVEVVRRQADGRWLFAIDLPFGVEAGAKP